MAVTCKKLFKRLIDRDMKKQELAEKVTMEVIEKVCRTLDVTVNDITGFTDY